MALYDERISKARDFVKKWKEKNGDEIKESRSFWIDLLQDVLGIESVTDCLEFERVIERRKIDIYSEDYGVLIENKSRGIALDRAYKKDKYGEETAYDQALWYRNRLGGRYAPRWIITCNFDEIYIYNMQGDTIPYVYDTEARISLDDLPKQLAVLDKVFDKRTTHIEQEKELSVQAAELVGTLYEALSFQYKHIDTDAKEQRSLNILIVRLVFLLFAEDAGLFEQDAFLEYMRSFSNDLDQMRAGLIALFKVLNQKVSERDEYLSNRLQKFPYVNGGLFEEDIIIPQFTTHIVTCLLDKASAGFNWAQISPTIFGAAFESTVNPETRKQGGIHYTSVENIHKVIDPLFLSSLKEELNTIEGGRHVKIRQNNLINFRDKIASLQIFDPACGSGNFLTETYLELRRLENRVIKDLVNLDQGKSQKAQTFLDGGYFYWEIKVNINQFYGIEINDFAVSVARTALWIAEAQAMAETIEITGKPSDFLPLTHNENIHHANALRIDWNTVLPSDRCSFIIGNPPFVGQDRKTKDQAVDVEKIFGKGSQDTKQDYVLCWYKVALDYMKTAKQQIEASFVSTATICLGESVPTFWKRMFNEGIEIIFARHSFAWKNEATDNAQVNCVIIGFTFGASARKKYLFDNNEKQEVTTINAYLEPKPNRWIKNRSSICVTERLKIIKGSEPSDKGGLQFTPSERDALVKKYPILNDYLRPFMGASEWTEYQQGTINRYCFWYDEKVIDSEGQPRYKIPDFAMISEIKERLQKIVKFREHSPAPRIQVKAKVPYWFVQRRQPKERMLLFPRIQTNRRKYIPFGFIDPDVIIGDSCYVLPKATLYDFGVLSSRMHIIWFRNNAGKLGNASRYTPAIYNNFPYPAEITQDIMDNIIDKAKQILEIRANYADNTLGELYSGMPFDLQQAHEDLDIAVEQAYNFTSNGDDQTTMDFLVSIYKRLKENPS